MSKKYNIIRHYRDPIPFVQALRPWRIHPPIKPFFDSKVKSILQTSLLTESILMRDLNFLELEMGNCYKDISSFS